MFNRINYLVVCFFSEQHIHSPLRADSPHPQITRFFTTSLLAGMIGGIGRDESIFFKVMFGLRGSRANMSHKLKMHVRCVTSALLTPHLSIC